MPIERFTMPGALQDAPQNGAYGYVRIESSYWGHRSIEVGVNGVKGKEPTFCLLNRGSLIDYLNAHSGGAGLDKGIELFGWSLWGGSDYDAVFNRFNEVLVLYQKNRAPPLQGPTVKPVTSQPLLPPPTSSPVQRQPGFGRGCGWTAETSYWFTKDQRKVSFVEATHIRFYSQMYRTQPEPILIGKNRNNANLPRVLAEAYTRLFDSSEKAKIDKRGNQDFQLIWTFDRYYQKTLLHLIVLKDNVTPEEIHRLMDRVAQWEEAQGVDRINIVSCNHDQLLAIGKAISDWDKQR